MGVVNWSRANVCLGDFIINARTLEVNVSKINARTLEVNVSEINARTLEVNVSESTWRLCSRKSFFSTRSEYLFYKYRFFVKNNIKALNHTGALDIMDIYYHL